jgi:hypothetical protein
MSIHVSSQSLLHPSTRLLLSTHNHAYFVQGCYCQYKIKLRTRLLLSTQSRLLPTCLLLPIQNQASYKAATDNTITLTSYKARTANTKSSFVQGCYCQHNHAYFIQGSYWQYKIKLRTKLLLTTHNHAYFLQGSYCQYKIKLRTKLLLTTHNHAYFLQGSYCQYKIKLRTRLLLTTHNRAYFLQGPYCQYKIKLRTRLLLTTHNHAYFLHRICFSFKHELALYKILNSDIVDPLDYCCWFQIVSCIELILHTRFSPFPSENCFICKSIRRSCIGNKGLTYFHLLEYTLMRLHTIFNLTFLTNTSHEEHLRNV